MTEEEQLLLNDLKANSRLVFSKFSELEDEKRAFGDHVDHLNKEIEKLKGELGTLHQKNEQLRLATHILSGVDENKEAKRKINKLVREIDKCIALLNQ